ncbi:hypothetical protein H4Q26_003256 [Puccinia striiformis f. sp. tritici PST-130]|nr:hypothetical protein H4Q26_003256 [Puccinia striiformis f. sp. tritici PST-130]
MKQAFVVITQLFFASSILARSFTIRNNCPFTIWPAYFTNPDSPTRLTSQPAGWEAQGATQLSFEVPDRWAGRFWGRRNCDFSKSGPTSCATGGCNGGLVCDAQTGSGVPPATLAEFKLNGDGGQDFYDVSNVDGSNLPVRITNNKGCPTPACPNDLNPGCPDDRLKVRDGNGVTIGCLSACQANLDVTTTIRRTAALAVTTLRPPARKKESSFMTISRTTARMLTLMPMMKAAKVLSGLATNLPTTLSPSAPKQEGIVYKCWTSKLSHLVFTMSLRVKLTIVTILVALVGLILADCPKDKPNLWCGSTADSSTISDCRRPEIKL